MSEAAATIEYWCLDTVWSVIRRAAEHKVFRPIGNDHTQPVWPESVIKRFNSRPSRDEASRSGETSIPMPGFIVTYKGHKRPPSAGENNVDDGILMIQVQLVDDGDDGDATNAQSYLRWMADVRERLQQSHDSHLSPLENCPSHLGQVYMVHVADSNPADETDWQFHEKMRQALAVSCFTRTER